MTRDEILNMPAGREMDALVSKKIFGIPKSEIWLNVFQPSTSIASAWKVVEKYLFQIHRGASGYLCVLMTPEEIEGQDVFEASADTAPLAICRAALLAVMETE